MMEITSMSTILIFMTKNPVKMSTMILMLATLMFTTLWWMTGLTWVSLILILLFTGGILIMFMIFSSFHPNEAPSKMKAKLFLGLTITAVALAHNLTVSTVEHSNPFLIKVWFQSSSSSMAVLGLILLYFNIFLKILKKEETSMKMYTCQKESSFVNWKSKKLTIIMNRKSEKIQEVLNNSLWDLPSPSTMTYFWNFGSTLGICLLVQILTGLFLTFHYTAMSEESFSSVVSIMREIWSGWIIRFVHMNGASMFFLFAYLHLFRGIYYMSASHKKVWSTGVLILIILMGISFLGYVLPWGQMSYWAVAVITNLLSVAPIVGESLVNWVWGGFSVGAPTLTRFYSFHFILPFVLTMMVFFHLIFLHKEGSSNSLGLNSNMDKIYFHPYFTIKDLIYIMAGLTLFIMISFYLPFMLGDAVNNVPANPMQTPVHIQPEWYFLPSYAILRALPSKTAGVLALLLSVSIYFVYPLYKMKFSTKFTFHRKTIFWILFSSFLVLMKMGSLPAEEPYIMVSKVTSMIYFSSILMLNI